MKTFLAVIAILVAAASTSGCGGYTTDSLHPAEIRTVAVPTFQSLEFRRGLEQELTRELIEMIKLRTPYKITTQERADTILQGHVTDLAATAVAEDEDDATTMAQVTLSVSFRWKDLRTGKTICEGQPQQPWHFAPSEDQTLRSAQTTAIRKLAEAIVEKMEKSW